MSEIYVGPYSKPLGVDVNAWAQISGGDPEYPDMQTLLLATSSALDFGFVIKQGLGYTDEVIRNYIDFLNL